CLALDVAGGLLNVFDAQGAHDVEGIQVVTLQQFLVEPHAHGARPQSAVHDAATTLNRLDALLQVIVNEAVDLLNGSMAVNTQPDDGELVEIHLADDGRVDVVGQAVGRGADGVLHVLHGDVDVAAQAEEDCGDGDAFEALRLDVVNPLHAGDGILDNVGDV